MCQLSTVDFAKCLLPRGEKHNFRILIKCNAVKKGSKGQFCVPPRRTSVPDSAAFAQKRKLPCPDCNGIRYIFSTNEVIAGPEPQTTEEDTGPSLGTGSEPARREPTIRESIPRICVSRDPAPRGSAGEFLAARGAAATYFPAPGCLTRGREVIPSELVAAPWWDIGIPSKATVTQEPARGLPTPPSDLVVQTRLKKRKERSTRDVFVPEKPAPTQTNIPMSTAQVLFERQDHSTTPKLLNSNDPAPESPLLGCRSRQRRDAAIPKRDMASSDTSSANSGVGRARSRARQRSSNEMITPESRFRG